MTIETHPRNVLVMGRSQPVLDETVAALQGLGYIAKATNDFSPVTGRFDLTKLDLVVFGGQVPHDRQAELREQISMVNPGVIFVQGLAGIPGLIVKQIQGVFAAEHKPTQGPTYTPETRTIRLTVAEPHDVNVTAWWTTSTVPPHPKSDSLILLDDRLAAGEHTIQVPDQIPPRRAFATVQVDAAIYAFGISTPDSPRPEPTTQEPSQMKDETTPFGAQLIGRTENALRAILERQLAETDVTYAEWVALVLAATGSEPPERAVLTDRVARALRVDAARAVGEIEALATAGLVTIERETSARVTPSERGRQLLERIRRQVGAVTKSLWGELPPADLAAAARVLATVLSRAEAELKAVS
jgi:DNA-binding MarR family transcriptional regulator